MITPFYVGAVIGFTGWVAIYMQSQYYQYMIEMHDKKSPPDNVRDEDQEKLLQQIAQLETKLEEIKSNVSTLMLKAGFKV